MKTRNGRIYLGQEKKWAVRFANGQVVHVIDLYHTGAIRKAARAICQPASEVIEVLTAEGQSVCEAYKNEGPFPYRGIWEN